MTLVDRSYGHFVMAMSLHVKRLGTINSVININCYTDTTVCINPVRRFSMVDPRLLTIVLAGVCSGAVLGACIPTNTERKIRSGNNGWWPFSNASMVGIIFNQLFWLTVVGCALTFVAVAILSAGEAYPLCQQYDRETLTLSWFIGAGIAKWGRYLYWKRKDQWL